MSDTKPSGGGSKSRTGCTECKRKRVKCDEGKPVCGKCNRHPDRCSYALKLSWTQGRPFKKPRIKEPWVIDLDGDAASSSSEPLPPNSTTQSAAGSIDGNVPSFDHQSQSQRRTGDAVPQDGDCRTSKCPTQLSHCDAPSYTRPAPGIPSGTIPFDSCQDSFFISTDGTTLAADDLVDPPDTNPEHFDEGVERDQALVPYQHYLPPSSYSPFHSSEV